MKKPWTMHEVLILIRLITQDEIYGTICGFLNRSMGSVVYMEKKLRRGVTIDGHVVGFCKRKVK